MRCYSHRRLLIRVSRYYTSGLESGSYQVSVMKALSDTVEVVRKKGVFDVCVGILRVVVIAASVILGIVLYKIEEFFGVKLVPEIEDE